MSKSDCWFYRSTSNDFLSKITDERLFTDKNIVLEGFEWGIIEPCLSANCDLIQAQLVEASRSMGGDGFGMSVSEAEQAYNQAKELMPKNAFVEPPFSFKTLGGN